MDPLRHLPDASVKVRLPFGPSKNRPIWKLPDTELRYLISRAKPYYADLAFAEFKYRGLLGLIGENP